MKRPLPGQTPARPAGEARDQCGVVGLWGDPHASATAYWALLALQHRGQESAGIASLDEAGRVHLHRGMGLVSDALGPEQLNRLPGHAAIGHVRYSTTGAPRLENAQPILSRFRGRFLALAHNGNLVNAPALRRQLEAEGAIFQTTTDTEVVAHLAARHGGPMEAALSHSLRLIAGAWALVFLDPDGVLAARDPLGIRPLSVGVIEQAVRPVWVVASETCALDAVGATFVRDVAPGELVRINGDGVRTVDRIEPPPDAEAGLCAFEAIYLARPDSVLFGQSVHALRKETGRRLAREHPAPGDLVTGVPDSSLSAAMGYAEELGLPFEMGLIRNRYIGRTFIQPGAARRHLAVSAKLNPVRKVVEGRRVVLVDDSIVRGTTIRHIVQLLRHAGAREVHVRIASPPYRFPCHYGVDTARREELVAWQFAGTEPIRQAIGADSLGYLSLEGLMDVLARGAARPKAGAGPVLSQAGENRPQAGTPRPGACLACFTGRYPVPVEGAGDKLALEPDRDRAEDADEADAADGRPPAAIHAPSSSWNAPPSARRALPSLGAKGGTRR